MFELNALLAIPGLILGGLLMWAFRRYALTLHGTITQHFGAAMFWVNVTVTGRSIWWDFFVGFGFGNVSNWVWNLIGLYVSYHALKALYLLIPTYARDNYNLITCVFYPYRLRRKLNDDEIS